MSRDYLDHAREVLKAEAAALEAVATRLDNGFIRVASMLGGCRGRVAVTGVGKSADIGAKIVGTFNSTGTRAYQLDATKARHGDLGMVHPDDVAFVLSHSGESDEIVRLLGPLRQMAHRVTALTGNRESSLARLSDAAIVYGPLEEACPLSLAPSTSTTVMLALGDALAFALSHRRGFSAEEFARFHPAGSLGRKLARVEEIMRRGPALRVAFADQTVREVFAQTSRHGRRTGAIILTNREDRLCGIFTDSDLARLIERRDDDHLDRPIRDVMKGNPLKATIGHRLIEAVEIMRGHKISELPVVDDADRPVGLLDITDLLDLLPVEERHELSVEVEEPPMRPRRRTA
jgi:arabinose-5-phosphate isomerase